MSMRLGRPATLVISFAALASATVGCLDESMSDVDVATRGPMADIAGLYLNGDTMLEDKRYFFLAADGHWVNGKPKWRVGDERQIDMPATMAALPPHLWGTATTEKHPDWPKASEPRTLEALRVWLTDGGGKRQEVLLKKIQANPRPNWQLVVQVDDEIVVFGSRLAQRGLRALTGRYLSEANVTSTIPGSTYWYERRTFLGFEPGQRFSYSNSVASSVQGTTMPQPTSMPNFTPTYGSFEQRNYMGSGRYTMNGYLLTLRFDDGTIIEEAITWSDDFESGKARDKFWYAGRLFELR